MLGREPFVAEDAAELEDALEAADDASLEEELERDPEVLGLVECVVVGFEGSGRAAGDLLRVRFQQPRTVNATTKHDIKLAVDG